MLDYAHNEIKQTNKQTQVHKTSYARDHLIFCDPTREIKADVVRGAKS